MKKLFTIACTLVLGGALALAQTGGSTSGQTPASGDQTKTGTTAKSGKKHKTHHKGAKKTKKSPASTTTTTTPK
jgi:hypothetical protein